MHRLVYKFLKTLSYVHVFLEKTNIRYTSLGKKYIFYVVYAAINILIIAPL